MASGDCTVTPTLSGYAFTPAVISSAPLTADATNFDFRFGKVWIGSGPNALASTASNWSGGEAPVENDAVRFTTSATKGCVWDVTSRMQAFELKIGFSSSVVAVADMEIGAVTVEAGEFLMGTREVRIFKNFSHTGGRFRASAAGIARWTGSALQTVSMVKNSLGNGLYDSYFVNFRIASSSTVRTTSELIVDEILNISSGRFETAAATVTLTGGTQNSVVGSYNWDDSGGVFVPGSGAIVFDSWIGSTYQVRQGPTNAFQNFTGTGDTAITAVSTLTVNGVFLLGGAGSSVRLDLGSTFLHAFNGPASVGPASTSGTATFSIGSSSATFLDGVTVGTATFQVQSGRINIRGSSLTITGQGTVSVPAGQTGRFVFWNGTQLKMNGGTLLVQGSSVFTSSAAGVSRYSADLNGTVNIQTATVFASLDVNGVRMGVGSIPTNLINLDFRNGATGGAALNFDPITVASFTVDSPIFDTTISTNVRAILNTALFPNADIDVVDSTGSRTGPSFEHDPSSIVNWGTLGTPSGFSGTSLGVESINWAWTKVNRPLGFVVISSTGGTLSPVLTFNTTYWIETGLSTNTAYTRAVRAFTDVGQADSSSVTRYTEAVVAANLTFSMVGISSVTLTWTANTNPAHTTFVVERSSDDATYSQLASGTLAALVPYSDQNLLTLTRYYYRIKSQNGDGSVVSTSIKASTITLAIPPPAILSVSPTTVTNLGVKTLVIIGANIQTGADVLLRRGSSLSISPITAQIEGTTQVTGTFNMTGAVAGTWDIEIENPDGKIGTGSGFLTVSNATSSGDVTIQSYSSSSGLSFTTAGGESSLTMAAGAMSDGRIYVSVDPVTTPLKINPTLITSANAAVSNLVFVPGSVREVLAFTSQGQFTNGFNSNVSLSISYPDQNRDAIIDSILLRVSGLRLMTLNETSGLWQSVAGASIDTSNRRVTVSLNHFSVYALFASPAADTLVDLKAYPSPWRPGSRTSFDAPSITLTNLTEAGTIRIYTLSMELVKEFRYVALNAGTATWDGKNADGDLVKSGVYLVQVVSSVGETKILKVGIER